MANGYDTKRIRKRNLLKKNPFCTYCKCQLATNPSKKDAPNYATLDHYIPKSKTGGIDIGGNKVLSCRQCNEAKADMRAEDFLIKLKSLKESKQP